VHERVEGGWRVQMREHVEIPRDEWGLELPFEIEWGQTSYQRTSFHEKNPSSSQVKMKDGIPNRRFLCTSLSEIQNPRLLQLLCISCTSP
jgi:hypothetical protein